MHTTIDTDWRLLEIEDEKAPQEPFVIAVKIRRKITCDAAGGILEAAIRLKAYAVAGAIGQQAINGHLVTLGGRFTPAARDAFWLTDGNMVVERDARGRRIGSYLQNEVIAWAKALNQPGTLRRITLDAGDARTVEARGRRNRFYEQFGITFEWSDPVGGIEHAAGTSTPGLRLDQLSTLEVVNGVRPFNLHAGLRHFVARGRKAEIAQREAEARRHASDEYHRKLSHGQERVTRLLAWTAGGAGLLVLVLAGVIGRLL